MKSVIVIGSKTLDEKLKAVLKNSAKEVLFLDADSHPSSDTKAGTAASITRQVEDILNRSSADKLVFIDANLQIDVPALEKFLNECGGLPNNSLLYCALEDNQQIIDLIKRKIKHKDKLNE